MRIRLKPKRFAKRLRSRAGIFETDGGNRKWIGIGAKEAAVAGAISRTEGAVRVDFSQGGAPLSRHIGQKEHCFPQTLSCSRNLKVWGNSDVFCPMCPSGAGGRAALVKLAVASDCLPRLEHFAQGAGKDAFSIRPSRRNCPANAARLPRRPGKPALLPGSAPRHFSCYRLQS